MWLECTGVVSGGCCKEVHVYRLPHIRLHIYCMPAHSLDTCTRVGSGVAGRESGGWAPLKICVRSCAC